MMNPTFPGRDPFRRLMALAIFGAVVLVCGVLLAAPEKTWPDRVWGNLLVTTYYLVTIGLGGMLFIALTYVSGGQWQVAFRRVPEAMARILPLTAITLLLVLAVKMNDYGWHHDGEGDPGTFWFKQYWLTPSFWLIRAVVYVTLWSLLSGWLLVRSRKQDTSGNTAMTVGNVRISALFLAVYAVTFSLASADWLMALEPFWFSTMWGVYNFAGMAQAALAVVIILGLVLRAPGRPLHGVFNDEHLHDLGKLLLGFSCFWMYIWFSQYMLIWYSNLPEETFYFITRTHGPWGPVVILAILLNWVVPFFLLLPKPSKRSEKVMIRIAAVVLIGRWVDLYLMVFPSIKSVDGERLFPTPVFGIWEVAAICLLIGAGSLLLLRSFASAKPVPEHDPYLAESLHYHAG